MWPVPGRGDTASLAIDLLALPRVAAEAALIRQACLPSHLRADGKLGGLANFCRLAWHVLACNGVRCLWGPLQQAVADHTQAWWEGLIPRLLVSQPPGTAKSMVASIYGMAWAWTWDPTMDAICVSANPRVANIGSVRSRALIASPWYQETFRPTWGFSRSQDTKGHYENTAGGARYSQAMGADLTGMRARRLLGDDLLDAKEILSGRNLDSIQRAWEWWTTVMSTRETLGQTVGEMLIAQRLAEGDPIGMALAQGTWSESTPDGWDSLCLPAEFGAETKAPTSIGWQDWRTTEGEVLDARLLTPRVLAKARANLTELGYQCQYNQIPSPAGGAMIQRNWMRYWGDGEHTALCPGKLIPELRRFEAPDARPWEAIIISVDGTWKNTTNSDYAVAQLWGVLDRGSQRCLRVLLAQFRERCLPSRMVRAVLELEALWGGCASLHNTQTVIEAKASGPNVASILRADLPNVQGFEVQGTQKGERLAAVAGEFEDGLVMTPFNVYSWDGAYRAELFAFPNGVRDDQVDATSQALLYAKQFDLGVGILDSGRPERASAYT
jgi:predicted phage terminase large subunit-like protein